MSAERTTLGERYAVAISSNHLEMSFRRQGSIDIVLAAGASDKVGTMLMRLSAEYAAAKGPLVLARKHLSATTEIARRIATRAKNIPQESKAYADAVRMATKLEDDAATAAKMAYAHILLKLSSLSTAKEAFCGWAMAQAHRLGFMDAGPMPSMIDPVRFTVWRAATEARLRVVNVLSGRILDLLLEPTCPLCEGRGFFGGYNNSPQIKCSDKRGRICNGERRLDDIGRNEAERDFCFNLLELSNSAIRQAEYEMQLKLKAD